MQRQSPENNNPLNPLFKVAALDIKRTDEKIGKRCSCNVLVTLNFKKSNDMVGFTYNKQGDEITVNFTLSIKKAALDINFYFDGQTINSNLSVSKVAFKDSLSINRTVTDIQDIAASECIEGSINAGGTLNASIPKIEAKARAQLKGQKEIKKKSGAKQLAKASYRSTGISVTHAGNAINWSINSTWTRREGVVNHHSSVYLLGEVFKNETTKEPVRACHVSWEKQGVSSALEIHGSVRVMIQDLMIEDIIFIDRFGKDLPWADIKKLNEKKMFTWNSEGFKKQLILLIISKYLRSLGMESQGASLEICSARG